MKNNTPYHQMSEEELQRSARRNRRNRNMLIIASVALSALFVVISKWWPETLAHQVMEGIYLAFGFILVTFIAESQKKLRLIRRELGVLGCSFS